MLDTALIAALGVKRSIASESCTELHNQVVTKWEYRAYHALMCLFIFPYFLHYGGRCQHFFPLHSPCLLNVHIVTGIWH